MANHSTFRERVEFGLETIPEDRTVAMPLRDLLFVHQTLGELIRFFHQPDHYRDLLSVEKFLGSKDNFSTAFSVLSEAYYQRMREMMPEDIDEAFSEGNRFEHPLTPEYYDVDYPNNLQGDS